MLLGEPYARVSRVARTVDPHALDTGLEYKECIHVAKKLGHVLVATTPTSLAGQTGILYVQRKDHRYHAVVLFQGIIIDPADGMIAIPDVYLAAEESKIYRLLIL